MHSQLYCRSRRHDPGNADGGVWSLSLLSGGTWMRPARRQAPFTSFTRFSSTQQCDRSTDLSSHRLGGWTQTNMMTLGWKCRARAAPSCDIFNLGFIIFQCPLHWCFLTLVLNRDTQTTNYVTCNTYWLPCHVHRIHRNHHSPEDSDGVSKQRLVPISPTFYTSHIQMITGFRLQCITVSLSYTYTQAGLIIKRYNNYNF